MGRIFVVFGVICGCAPTTDQGLLGASGSDGVQGQDGANCWDTNGNGEPDPAEDINADGSVDALDCRGSNGAPGQDCWDTNGNGEPDPEEDLNGDGFVDVDDCQGGGSSSRDTGGLDTGSVALDAVYLGNLVIESLVVAEYFCAHYDRVYGDLSVSEWREDTVDALSCLVEVTGDLSVQMYSDYSLSTLQFPVLERVGGEVQIPQFAEANMVSFPALRSAGMLWVDSTQDCVLDELLFPSLETVERTFAIYDVFCIDTLEAPQLREVGDFLLQNVDDLDSSDGFASLTTVNGSFTIYYNQDLSDLSGFETIDFIGDNFNVAYNSGFSDSQAQNLADSISTIVGDVSIYGNSGR